MKCDICNSGDLYLRYSMKDNQYNITDEIFDIYKCKYCDACKTLQNGKNIQTEQYYLNEYQAFNQETELNINSGTFSRLYRSLFTYVINNRYEIFDYFTGRNIRNVLDVGCGSGQLINALQKKNCWKITGLEPSLTAVENAKKTGLNIIHATIDSYKTKDKFDLIYLIHVLEHLDNPHGSLQKIRLLLNDNGYLVIALPNINNLERIIFGKYWDGWDLPRHIYHYSVKSLKLLLMSNAFSINRIYYENYSILGRSLKNKTMQNVPYNKRTKNKKVYEKLSGILQATLKYSGAVSIIAQK